VKGSLFIGTISHAGDKSVAENLLDRFRQEFHDATHNCYAYRIDESEYRFSDDGEPSGTAGKPILNMIDKYELLEVLVVVTRYYGGTKLGIGGLMRAYSECAEQLLHHAKINKQYNYHKIYIKYPFELENKIRQLLHRYRVRIFLNAFPDTMQGYIEVLPSQVERLKADMLSIGKGKIKIKDS
jgi:uncharacterized YigZ family protein